jgi:hypothetical protein
VVYWIAHSQIVSNFGVRYLDRLSYIWSIMEIEEIDNNKLHIQDIFTTQFMIYGMYMEAV